MKPRAAAAVRRSTAFCAALALAALPAFGQATPAANSTAAPAAANSTATPATAAPAASPAPSPTRQARGGPQKIGGIQANSTVTSYKFAFGSGPAPDGCTLVSPDTAYSDKLGFGFDKGIKVSVVPKDKSAPNAGGVITADSLIYFSTALPEGNYKVTVALGNPDVATNTSVLAESRRLMLENVQTKPGEYVAKTFIVNTRRPQYPGGEVRLKGGPPNFREDIQEAWDWDNGLTLEFIGDHPSIASLQIEKVNVPTVFVIGDSTSCDQMVEPYNSWGQTITRFFKPDVAVANHGESGETIGDNLSRNRFDKIWSLMKPGDYIFITSGHNERNGKNGNMANDQAFYDDFKKVVDQARKLGGIPVLVTPISRAPGGPSLGPYPGELKQLADAEKVAYIDLQVPTATFYRALPDFHVAFATPKEATHNNDFGSYEVSKMVIAGIQQNNLPLAKSIVGDFKPLEPAHPDKPEDFKVVPTPKPAVADKPPGS